MPRWTHVAESMVKEFSIDGPVDEDDLPAWQDNDDFTFSDKQDRFMRFRNKKLEANYALELDRGCSTTCRICYFVWASLALINFLFNGDLPELLNPDLAVRCVVLGQIFGLLTLLLVGVLSCFRPFTFEALTAFLCYVLCFLLFVADRVRVSRIVGSTFYLSRLEGCGALTCHDDSRLVLLLTIASCLTPALIGMRLVRFLWIPVWGGFLYFGTCAFGPLTIKRQMANGLIYIAVCGLQCMGHAKLEKERRRRWLENMRLKISVAAQQKELMAQLARQQEIEDQMEALTQGFSPAWQGLPAAVTKVDDETIVLARAVPAPRQVFCGVSAALIGLGSESSPPARQLNASEYPVNKLTCTSPQGVSTVAEDCPNPLLARLTAARQADPLRLQSMAARMRNADYGLGVFFEDCVATFPELDFFFAVEEGSSPTSSGNGNFLEYQRTVGALFAVYWLSRLDLDGKQGFSFGHRMDWAVNACSRHLKRTRFFEDMSWSYFEEVVSLALGKSQERLEAMLCLTAFHDIMKVTEFCPQVAAAHAPYHGYSEGEIITDHDLALAYVLEYYPDMLPSFRILPPASREVVLFTQGKMHFNHGWFVQSEATPGHMLSQLKSVLHRAKPGDLSFYFLHWITDLSGAEGQPLAGAEKFVIRFPQSVLSSFLWSIPYLQNLHTRTETEVVEAYLQARFESALPMVAAPAGFDRIALMRLVVMAQSEAQHVLTAWSLLSRADFQVLVEELSRTGIEGQTYECWTAHGGPAFFVYYGPALLQCCTSSDEMATALSILASVYRAGRRLWPVTPRGGTVMLEIGSMKSKFAELLRRSGNPMNSAWILLRRAEMEAGVVLASGRQLNSYIMDGACFTVLDVSGPEPWALEVVLDV